MKFPTWLPGFLERESQRRASKPRTAEILARAAKQPTEANLLAASRVFGNGSFSFIPFAHPTRAE